ncbi:MAG: DUF480 domain-containing protein [Phycisphaerales bacterium]
MQLDRSESRVLGVLVEKAFTVQSAYPMTLNALISGANQKSNRDPMMSMDEDDVLSALDSMRAKGLTREVMLSGSRVPKYKHDARDALSIGSPELVVLTELLLRGPQTVGELRTRASRMHPLESTDVVASVLQSLADRETPLVRQIPGGRAPRWVQLLSPNLHPVESAAAGSSPSPAGTLDHSAAVAAPPAAAAPDPAVLDGLSARLDRLERAVGQILDALGESWPDPPGPPPAPENAD